MPACAFNGVAARSPSCGCRVRTPRRRRRGSLFSTGCTALGFMFAPALFGANDTDWPSYLGNDERSHYSSLAQINPSNVQRLTVAWTYRAGEVVTGARSEMECNPLVVQGVIFATLPGAKLIALD